MTAPTQFAANPGPGMPARRRSRKALWITSAIVVALLAAGTTYFFLAMWKRTVNLPYQIGTLVWGSQELPWDIEQALIPAKHTLRAESWETRRYAEQSNEYQLVHAYVVALESPDPAARVAAIFDALTRGWPENDFSFAFSDLHAVQPDVAGTGAASCGTQSISMEGGALVIGEPRHVYTQVVVCAWADAHSAGIVTFMDRDLADSEANFLMIWRAVELGHSVVY